MYNIELDCWRIKEDKSGRLGIDETRDCSNGWCETPDFAGPNAGEFIGQKKEQCLKLTKIKVAAYNACRDFHQDGIVNG